MACVIAWEQCVCNCLALVSLRLWLGAALICIHASICWGDAQRVEWRTLDLTNTALRGCCHQTKTCKQGQPWAVHYLGFSGTDAKTSWVVSWLKLLHSFLAELPLLALQHYGSPASQAATTTASVSSGGLAQHRGCLRPSSYCNTPKPLPSA